MIELPSSKIAGVGASVSLLPALLALVGDDVPVAAIIVGTKFIGGVVVEIAGVGGTTVGVGTWIGDSVGDEIGDDDGRCDGNGDGDSCWSPTVLSLMERSSNSPPFVSILYVSLQSDCILSSKIDVPKAVELSTRIPNSAMSKSVKQCVPSGVWNGHAV